MSRRSMEEFVSNLTESQKVALLYMLLGFCFFLSGFLSWLENS